MRRLLVFLGLVFVLLPSVTRAQENDFTAGQLVQVVEEEATLRDTPSDAGTSVGTVAAGDELQILADDPTENAGTFWWQVRSLERGLTGWLPDSALGPKYLEPTPDPGKRSAGPCEGMQEYQSYYLMDYSSTALTHLEATGILRAADSSGVDPQAFVAALTEREILLLSDFYHDLAEMMDGLSPPDFALEWHQLQRDSFQVTGDIYRDAATMGFAAAGEQHAVQAFALVAGLNEYFTQPGACEPFQTWAREQTLLGSLLA